MKHTIKTLGVLEWLIEFTGNACKNLGFYVLVNIPSGSRQLTTFYHNSMIFILLTVNNKNKNISILVLKG